MAERPLRADGNLAVALSAWMFLLHGRGMRPASDVLQQAIGAVDGEQTGRALVDAVVRALDGAVAPDEVLGFARTQYPDAVLSDLGDGDREQRTRRIRTFQFRQNMPWLARIYERHNGVVQPTWILVQRVTDQVLAMDPDPWDGIEEARVLPVADFMVLWELDACSSVAASAC